MPFDGKTMVCGGFEPLEFYKKLNGAEVTGLMRWKCNPDETMESPSGYEEKVMNAAFRIGETELMPTTLKLNVFFRHLVKE